MLACQRPSYRHPTGRTGTAAGARAHYRAGEELCPPCRAAHNAASLANHFERNPSQASFWNGLSPAERRNANRAWERRWRAIPANREAANERKRRWSRTQRGKRLTRARVARYHQADGSLVPVRPARASTLGCVCCGATEHLEVDHIVPVSKGGHPTDARNQQMLCRACNASKGAGWRCRIHHRALGAEGGRVLAVPSPNPEKESRDEVSHGATNSVTNNDGRNDRPLH